jgi:hypothetical protein
MCAVDTWKLVVSIPRFGWDFRPIGGAFTPGIVEVAAGNLLFRSNPTTCKTKRVGTLSATLLTGNLLATITLLRTLPERVDSGRARKSTNEHLLCLQVLAQTDLPALHAQPVPRKLLPTVS